MSYQTVLTPKGFVAASADLKPSEHGGAMVLLVNQGPAWNAAAVLPNNPLCAPSVRATREVMRSHAVNAVVLYSGNANAFNGANGTADTREIQDRVAQAAGVPSERVAVCAKGQFAQPLPMDQVRTGISNLVSNLGSSTTHAAAISSVVSSSAELVNQAGVNCGDWSVGGIVQGTGTLSEALDAVIVCLTTDALVPAFSLDKALRRALESTFSTLDRSKSPLTNDTVLLLASGASGVTPNQTQLDEAVLEVCQTLLGQLLTDPKGVAKSLTLTVVGAANHDEASQAAMAIAGDERFRRSLLGTSIAWPRALAIAGKAGVCVGSEESLAIYVNGTQLCGEGKEDSLRQDIEVGSHLSVTVDLGTRGSGTATVRTLLEPV
ncbi:bifunctional ornithine acetyltransferase/N-acetylglutamate synthase [Corynebacterium sp. NML130628]|uniref:bifunctional ornithine acetyltransferase/N-acetylglutamate synthase n=1 Tax=Corynebacterium sp. NML130628 TaxID=1906333 RepID=UPI0008FB4F10|nr:bifunctional ornithine acetyltransferase/N-acetylglutamate synthase [Corynebacterium sp. NML130628]OIR41351.1 hypothetical protein BJP07_09110 [Corynebacterium sp. NML130628]